MPLVYYHLPTTVELVGSIQNLQYYLKQVMKGISAKELFKYIKNGFEFVEKALLKVYINGTNNKIKYEVNLHENEECKEAAKALSSLIWKIYGLNKLSNSFHLSDDICSKLIELFQKLIASIISLYSSESKDTMFPFVELKLLFQNYLQNLTRATKQIMKDHQSSPAGLCFVFSSFLHQINFVLNYV